MLYLGIDQHARQITISVRDENGDVLQARQVSTQPEKVNALFQRLTRGRLRGEEQFVAVLEVCGFNEWLIRMLRDYRCHKVILIQPEERKNRKTDRRDAAALSELLWVNRSRLLAGQPVRGVRQVDIPSKTDQETRRLSFGFDPWNSPGTGSVAPVVGPVGRATGDIRETLDNSITGRAAPEDENAADFPVWQNAPIIAAVGRVASLMDG